MATAISLADFGEWQAPWRILTAERASSGLAQGSAAYLERGGREGGKERGSEGVRE